MSMLFEKVSINGMNLKNRFVRSSTWEGLAQNDGSVTVRLCKMMAELAKNEIGLIISGYAYTSPGGQSSPYQMAAHDDCFLQGLREMAQAVHSAGGKIALQLSHAGRFSNPALTGQTPMGPSAEESEGQLICRAMSKKDILDVITEFTQAASRSKQAGFDAIQLHAAHGFLLSQFLSPAFNRRTDEYGGTLENRARLLLEVVQNIRKTVGPEYPILVKLNSEDFLENGMTRDDAIEVAAMLERATVDSIEISGGTMFSQEFVPPRPCVLENRKEEVYYREAAKHYKQKIGIPLMLVGGIRSIETAEELIASGLADFISLCRPLIGEPDLIKLWLKGDRRKSECISCNECLGPAVEGKGIYCIVQNNLQRVLT